MVRLGVQVLAAPGGDPLLQFDDLEAAFPLGLAS
jgi:hypothetical protein